MIQTPDCRLDSQQTFDAHPTRRRFVRQCLLTGMGAAVLMSGCRRRVPAQNLPPAPFSEEQAGDPNASVEELAVDLTALQEQFELVETIGQRKPAATMANAMLDVARQYLGVSRTNNPKQVTQFLQLFGLDLRYNQGSYVPFCAAGVSFAACQAYCVVAPTLTFSNSQPHKNFRELIPTIAQHYFKPDPACRIIYQDAMARKAWVPLPEVTAANILPGWLVFFDWRNSGSPGHVGLVERATAAALTTIEFNTSDTNNANGGTVARRVRSFDGVMGFVRTH